ncbi:MAG: hypothetical protein RQ856_01680 [Candidatus Izemoplasmatales bacterium]|nr:hypothetical protein [Candidatus Izemoplasmatales bacterium]
MLRKEKKMNKIAIIMLIVVLEAIIYLISYLSGGIYSWTSQLMYLPIIVAGSFLGLNAGIISALFASFLIGPLMSIDLTFFNTNEILFWLFRMITLVSAGLLSGFVFDCYRRNHRMLKVEEIECPKNKLVENQ